MNATAYFEGILEHMTLACMDAGTDILTATINLVNKVHQKAFENQSYKDLGILAVL